ncbi:hypothetical protein [Nitrosopumilus adriaticus]|uniref:Uncharacterized protein n=1 Tax=Nitrosopumilus adriaticus TaxID=1580092 RepID=A0A0D5C0M7_9ARCH|nr:hypothetical protein [Nitrosopumilus adriaticus]AJW70329.1 hypothetical protein NADRNF5_0633 [Nitrosopumilus adriaticus]
MNEIIQTVIRKTDLRNLDELVFLTKTTDIPETRNAAMNDGNKRRERS